MVKRTYGKPEAIARAEMLEALMQEGVPKREAYRRVWGKEELEDGKANKYACMALKKLEKYRERAREGAESEAERGESEVMTKEERMRVLTELVRLELERGKSLHVIKAIAEMNRMDGSYAAEKLELKREDVVEFVRKEMAEASKEPLVVPQRVEKTAESLAL